MTIRHPFRKTHLTKHHLHAKQRGGDLSPCNTLRLWRDKHDAWHFVFGNLNLSEIIHNLYARHSILIKTSHTKQWKFLFKDKPIKKVIALLKRVRKFKRSLKTTDHAYNV